MLRSLSIDEVDMHVAAQAPPETQDRQLMAVRIPPPADGLYGKYVSDDVFYDTTCTLGCDSLLSYRLLGRNAKTRVLSLGSPAHAESIPDSTRFTSIPGSIENGLTEIRLGYGALPCATFVINGSRLLDEPNAVSLLNIISISDLDVTVMMLYRPCTSGVCGQLPILWNHIRTIASLLEVERVREDDEKYVVGTFSSSRMLTLSPGHPEIKLRLALEKLVQEADEENSASFLEHKQDVRAGVSRLIALSPAVKTVCEVGFNYGYMAATWLNANPSIRLYSFDLCHAMHTEPCANFINEQIPGRMNLTCGDSLMTVRQFAHQKTKPMCDIVSIDGSKKASVREADIINLRQASHPWTTLIVNDIYCSTKACQANSALWRTLVKSEYVKEHKCFSHEEDARSGFCIGSYLWKQTGAMILS